MWMKTYPRLMDQMRDIMEEWKEEREQLLINAEQTHAYCQSWPFRSMRGALRSACASADPVGSACARAEAATSRASLCACAGETVK